MNETIRKGARRAVFAAAFCLSSLAWGQTVNFGITGAGPSNLAGVYTGPYTLSNNGTSVLGFCDDFLDNVTPPQYWTALTTDISQLPNSPSTVYFTGGIVNNVNYSEVTKYIAAAILATQSLQVYQTNSALTSDLSYALWGIFDPSLLYGYQTSCSPGSEGCLGSSDLSTARTQMLNALNAASGYASGAAYEAATGTQVSVFTPTLNGTQPSSASNRPQEFVVVKMGEVSTLSMLAIDLGGAAGLFFLVRRRRARQPSANA